MTLRDNVHRLVNEHLKLGPTGKPHMVSALLAELRDAVTPGNSGAGDGAGGLPIPINPDAVEMLARVERELKSEYWEMLAIVWPASLEELLLQLPSGAPDAAWEAYLDHVTLDWVDKITTFLWPVKPRRKLFGKTCPSCSQAVHGEDRAVCLTLGCWDTEGELAKIGDWNIRCEACEAAWSGNEVAWLLRAFDTPEPKVALPS